MTAKKRDSTQSEEEEKQGNMPDVDQEIIEPLKAVLVQLQDEDYLKENCSNRLQQAIEGRREPDNTLNQALYRVITFHAGYAVQGVKQKDPNIQITFPKLLQPGEGVNSCTKRWVKLQRCIEKIHAAVIVAEEPQPIEVLENKPEPDELPPRNLLPDPKKEEKGESSKKSAPLPPYKLPNQNKGETKVTDPNARQQTSTTDEKELRKEFDQWFKDHATELSTANVDKLKELRNSIPPHWGGYLAPFMNRLIDLAQNQQDCANLQSQLEAAQKNDEQKKLNAWLNEDNHRQQLFNAGVKTIGIWRQALPKDELGTNLGLLLSALEAREIAKAAAEGAHANTQVELKAALDKIKSQKDPEASPVTTTGSQNGSKWQRTQAWCRANWSIPLFVCMILVAFWLGSTVFSGNGKNQKNSPTAATTGPEQPEKTEDVYEPYIPDVFKASKEQ